MAVGVDLHQSILDQKFYRLTGRRAAGTQLFGDRVRIQLCANRDVANGHLHMKKLVDACGQRAPIDLTHE